MAEEFRLPGTWLTRRINVLLYGVGATGTQVMDILAQIHGAALDSRHPGISLTAIDGDKVTEANMFRQRFGPSDLGEYKASLLVHRYNLFYGFDWQDVPRFCTVDRHGRAEIPFSEADLIISCVDTAALRVAIAQGGAAEDSQALWLDFGNTEHRGQVVLGHLSPRAKKDEIYLPNIFDLRPELATMKDTKRQSCSLAEALSQQELLVNRAVALQGMQILMNLLQHGKLTIHGAFIETRECRSRPLYIDPKEWAKYGYAARPIAA